MSTSLNSLSRCALLEMHPDFLPHLVPPSTCTLIFLGCLMIRVQHREQDDLCAALNDSSLFCEVPSPLFATYYLMKQRSNLAEKLALCYSWLTKHSSVKKDACWGCVSVRSDNINCVHCLCSLRRLNGGSFPSNKKQNKTFSLQHCVRAHRLMDYFVM